MTRHLRTIGLFGMALMVAFSVMLPQATTAREVANTTPDDAAIMDSFSGVVRPGETKCHKVSTQKFSYYIWLYSNGIADFYLLENDSSEQVKTTRVEDGTGRLQYYRYSSVTQLQICVFNLSFDTDRYRISF